MTFFDMPEDQREISKNYIKSFTDALVHNVDTTMDRVLGYLYYSNGGGLVAAVAYVSSAKTLALGMKVAIKLFFLGLLCAVVRSALDYFATQRRLNEVSRDNRLFFNNQLDWNKYVQSSQRKTAQWHYIMFGVISGVLFFVGLWIGVCSITAGAVNS
jgi:hypothetical protein